MRFKPPKDASSAAIHAEIEENQRSRDLSPIHFSIRPDLRTVDLLPPKLARSNSDESKGRNDRVMDTGMRKSSYTFDRIFPCKTTQHEIFDSTITPILNSFLDGYNGTIICYGQTGSGKTFTMMGDLPNVSADDDDDNDYDYDDGIWHDNGDENRGIIPRLFDTIFQRIHESPVTFQYTIALSYFEIYNEEITDLLSIDGKADSIYIREVQDRGRTTVYVEGLEKVYVANIEDINRVTSLGNSRRRLAETKMNIASSRSHTILRVEINVRKDEDTGNVDSDVTSKEAIYQSTLFLVDLAGSERISKSGTNSSTTLLKETIGINSSLSALGNVINALGADSRGRSKASHTPYRDSKLTRVLQNSLGGNAKTAMIVNCSSDLSDINETVSSLRFAQRAKNVQNLVTMNKLIVDAKKKQSSAAEGEGRRNSSPLGENRVPTDMESKTWKSKYVNALKKIVDLETKLESSKFHGNENEITDEALPKLLEENERLRSENNNFKKVISDTKNGKLSQSVDSRNYISKTNRTLDSLRSDVEIYKKLLVSKTDRILQLEADLGESDTGARTFETHRLRTPNGSKSNVRNAPADSKLTMGIMKEMTETIQMQNDSLLEQVEHAERLLRQKEAMLQETTVKLANRGNAVLEEQLEVEKKLENMSKRLVCITDNGDLHALTNDAGNYSTSTTTSTSVSTDSSPTQVNTPVVRERDEEVENERVARSGVGVLNGGKKKITGLNLQIVKPR